MNLKRVISLLAILVLILSLTPAISAQGGIAARIFSHFQDVLNHPENFKRGFKVGKRIHKILKDLEDHLSFLYEYGFSVPVSFVVGGVTQQVNALIAINSQVTWIDSCGYPPSGPRKCVRYPNNSSPAAALCISTQEDTYQTNFFWFQSANAGVNNQDPKGVLSFSRNTTNIYSIVNNFHQYRGFSYYFSNRLFKRSYITFEKKPFTTFNPNKFQAVPLLQNPGYENLYYVPAPQIYIGSQLLQINPIVDFNNGVIIDSAIPYIMLATKVYSELMTQLQSVFSPLQVDTDDNGMMCSHRTLIWPKLTLSFQTNSGSAQMVLRKHNYVIRDSQTGRRCAAIYRSQDVSVIGIIAQLDRNMIFDVEGSMLYFDKDPQLR